MNECTHIGSSGLYEESGNSTESKPRPEPREATCYLHLFRVDGRAWILTFPRGASILSPATKEGIEEGWCLAFGQASFVFFNKEIKRTSNLTRERKFQDIEKGPTPEGSKGL